MDGLFPYVKSEAIFTCLDDTENKPYKFRSGSEYGSYAMNATYWVAGDNATPPYEEPLASVAKPAETVWVMELASTALLNNFEIEWANVASHPAIIKGPNGYWVLRNIAERHQGTTNVLWCDGHAKATKLEYLTRANSLGVWYRFTIEDDEDK